MNRSVELMEAKNVLGTEKVFFNENNITVASFGKYAPCLTYILPMCWNIDSKGDVESPIKWRDYPEIIRNMNIDFDGETKGIFGNYWTSKNGRLCFKITSPDKAKYILIKSSWGGCFNKTRGQLSSYAEEVGATWFRRASSNGGGSGYDYWILPVGFVAGCDTKDVSTILKKYTKEEEKRVDENEVAYKKLLEEKEASRNAKEKYLSRLLVVCDYYKEHCTYDRFELLDDGFKYNGGYLRYYTEENIALFENSVKKMQEDERAKEKFLPLFHEYYDLAKSLGLQVRECGTSIYIGYEYFKYSKEGLDKFVDFLLLVQKRQIAEEEERRKKLLEAQILAKKLEDEKLAKEAGYPSNFSFWKHNFGATGNSRAFVIRPDGTLRERDSIDQANKNRLYRYDEGYEIWNQILGGELVITYTKRCTSEPFICEVFYRPEVVTEAQKEKIIEIQSQLSINVQGKKGLISGIESPLCEGWDV